MQRCVVKVGASDADASIVDGDRDVVGGQLPQEERGGGAGDGGAGDGGGGDGGGGGGAGAGGAGAGDGTGLDAEVLDAEALRRLRLGEGRPAEFYIEAPESRPLVVPVRVYSRTRGGPTAFGLWGRIVATLLVLAACWFLSTSNGVWPILLMLLGIPLVMVLRGIWHREPQPRPMLVDQSRSPKP